MKKSFAVSIALSVLFLLVSLSCSRSSDDTTMIFHTWSDTKPEPLAPGPSGQFTLYLKPLKHWTNVNIWYWGGDAGVNPAPHNQWPGTPMTDEGEGWFSISLGPGTSWSYVIFNTDGGDLQTKDILRTNEGWCVLTNIRSRVKRDLVYFVFKDEATIGGMISNRKSVPAVKIPADLDGYPVTSIAENAFLKNKSLKAVDLSTARHLKIIGTRVFKSCTGLAKVTFPGSLNTIRYGAFSYCRSLNNLDLSGQINLYSIGEAAFKYCDSLSNVTLPESLRVMDDKVFYNCSNLTVVKVYAKDPPVLSGNQVFEGCPLSAIFVPSDSVTSYQSAYGWSGFSNIISGLDGF